MWEKRKDWTFYLFLPVDRHSPSFWTRHGTVLHIKGISWVTLLGGNCMNPQRPETLLSAVSCSTITPTSWADFHTSFKGPISSKSLSLQFAVTSLLVLVVKSLPASTGDIRDMGSIPRLGSSPEGGHGNPLQYSCLENLMNKGAWWATVHGVAQSQTRLKRLSRSSGKMGKIL